MIGTILIGTIISMLALAVPLIFVRQDRYETGGTGRWLFWMLVVNLILNSLIVYFFTPALVGPFGGYQWLWFTLLVNAAIGFIFGATQNEYGHGGANQLASGTGSAVVFGVLFISLILIGIFTTWFTPNAKALAAYPNLQVSDSAYPEADVTHTVIVTPRIAKFKGGQVIASSGENLGSRYHADDYTLLAVKGHLYYVAPLVYNNFWANLQFPQSPGLVVVDAEDPNAEAFLKMDYKLHYLPAAMFNQDLVRHIYMNGYSGFRLVDPTLEVDDDWRPYFTVDLSHFVRGLTGVNVVGFILVDSNTGEITHYNIGEEPAWVDRVLPAVAVEEYIEWWGKWHAAPWFNLSKQGQEMPADNTPALVYNRTDGYPSWQFVMTSTSSGDHSSTQVVLFDTKTNKGTIYPKDSGLAVGSDVIHAFSQNPKNIKNYDVVDASLYNIYGHLTWVAVFESPSEGDAGRATFQAVGLMDARSVNGSNVIMEQSKEDALRVYKRWLADHGSNTTGPTQLSLTKEIEGFVDRIGADSQAGFTTYYLTIRDASGAVADRIFYGSASVSEKLPLTQVGDHVVIRYQDVYERTTAMETFNNVDVQVPLIDPTTGAPWNFEIIPTATPTPLPTATPTPTSLPLFEVTPTQ